MSNALRVVERFTRVDADTLEYRITVNDPRTWSAPSTVAYPMKLDNDYAMFEYACHEGTTACRTSSAAHEPLSGNSPSPTSP